MNRTKPRMTISCKCVAEFTGRTCEDVIREDTTSEDTTTGDDATGDDPTERTRAPTKTPADRNIAMI